MVLQSYNKLSTTFTLRCCLFYNYRMIVESDLWVTHLYPGNFKYHSFKILNSIIHKNVKCDFVFCLNSLLGMKNGCIAMFYFSSFLGL